MALSKYRCPVRGAIVDDDTTELCRRAGIETDREKLMELLLQITESLNEERKTTPKQDDTSP